MKKYTLLLPSLLLLCTGCGYLVSLLPDPDPDKLSGLSGEPPTLPPITQEGAGTMGCLVNGEVLVGRNTLASNPPPPKVPPLMNLAIYCWP